MGHYLSKQNNKEDAVEIDPESLNPTEKHAVKSDSLADKINNVLRDITTVDHSVHPETHHVYQR